MTPDEAYRALGVPSDASDEDIRAAYRQAAHWCHPDKNPGNKAAEEAFKRISEAYSILRAAQEAAARRSRAKDEEQEAYRRAEEARRRAREAAARARDRAPPPPPPAPPSAEPSDTPFRTPPTYYPSKPSSTNYGFAILLLLVVAILVVVTFATDKGSGRWLTTSNPPTLTPEPWPPVAVKMERDACRKAIDVDLFKRGVASAGGRSLVVEPACECVVDGLLNAFDDYSLYKADRAAFNKNGDKSFRLNRVEQNSARCREWAYRSAFLLPSSLPDRLPQ